MRRSTTLATLFAFALILLHGTFAKSQAAAGYDAWAKCKPGAYAKYKNETDAGGQKTVMEMTQKLVEVTADKVVIEVVTSMDMGGQKMDMPAQKIEIPKAGATTPNAAPNTNAAAGGATASTTTEEVTVGGQKVKCTVTTVTSDVGGQKSESKVWTSEEVPGGMVKSETKSAQMSATMTLVEFKK
jgi:hypothetical protein